MALLQWTCRGLLLFFFLATSEPKIFLFLIIISHNYCVPDKAVSGDDTVSISVPRWNLKNRFFKM